MRALVLTDFGQMDVADRPAPVPAADEVVIAVIATGICGSDIHGFTGENGRRHPGQVMGHETVGRIAELGSGVVGLNVGQVVTVNPVVLPDAARDQYAGREQHCPDKYVIGVRPDRDAAFAELLLAPALNIVPLPDDLPLLLGALVEPMAVAVHAIGRVEPADHERVLVIGGGPIGQSVALALTLTRASRVVLSEVDPLRRELVETLGVPTVDAATADVAAAVREALGGAADVVIDAVGVAASVAAAFAGSRLGARICLVGMGAQQMTVDAFRLSTDERSLLGSFAYSDDDFREAARLIAGSPDRCALLVSREVTPLEAQEAFAAAARGEAPPGKTFVRFSD